MYDHIVVPVAPDHIGEYSTSLEVARRLLSEAGRLSVLSVLEELPSYVGSYFPPDRIKKEPCRTKGCHRGGTRKQGNRRPRAFRTSHQHHPGMGGEQTTRTALLYCPIGLACQISCSARQPQGSFDTRNVLSSFFAKLNGFTLHP